MSALIITLEDALKTAWLLDQHVNDKTKELDIKLPPPDASAQESLRALPHHALLCASP